MLCYYLCWHRLLLVDRMDITLWCLPSVVARVVLQLVFCGVYTEHNIRSYAKPLRHNVFYTALYTVGLAECVMWNITGAMLGHR